MKRLIALLTLLALPLLVRAQTNVPPPVQAGQTWLNFLAGSSNLMTAAYGIYSTGTRSAGGGIALAYKISDFVAPAVRLDYLNHNFYQGSFSTQLQYPVNVSSKLTLVPFALGGVATPFGGAGNDNRTVQGIVGVGVAVRLDFLGNLGKRLDLLADWEKWSATDGNQYRIGILYKF